MNKLSSAIDQCLSDYSCPPLCVCVGQLKWWSVVEQIELKAGMHYGQYGERRYPSSVDGAIDDRTAAIRSGFLVTVETVQLFDLFLCPFNTLEVPNGPYAQLRSSIFVRNEQRIGMQLNARDRVHMVDAFLYTLCQRVRLVLTDNDDQNLSSVHDRLDTHRQRHPRNLERVVVEESRVVQHGIIGQRLDPRPRGQRRSRLVERNVTIGTHTGHEKIDPPHGLNLGFVLGALFQEIGRVAVEDMHVLRLNVDVAEKVVPHERMVRFRVRFGQRDVFVHVERDDVLE